MTARAAWAWWIKLRFLPGRWRDRLRVAVFQCVIALFRGADRWLGAGAAAVLVLPFTAAEVVRRGREYRTFTRLRRSLPELRWPDAEWVHFLQSVRTWQESLVVAALYDRLASPRWQRRLNQRGALPAFGERPVVIACVHTCGFALLRYWLRARGVGAAVMLRERPQVLVHMESVRQAGDARYGLTGVKHAFLVETELRQAIRFLRPGRAVVITLDGGSAARDVSLCDVPGHQLRLHDGAVRLARLTGAVLIPALALRLGPLCFELWFGTPVADETVARPETGPALAELARQIWLQLVQHPANFSGTLMEMVGSPRPAAPTLS